MFVPKEEFWTLKPFSKELLIKVNNSALGRCKAERSGAQGHKSTWDKETELIPTKLMPGTLAPSVCLSTYLPVASVTNVLSKHYSFLKINPKEVKRSSNR